MDVSDAESIDFEVDAEDLPEPIAAPIELGPPSLIAQDVHVTYRVMGTRARKSDEEAPSGRLARILARARPSSGGVTEVHAVRGVSFVAHHGESIAILGTNGSGKSTLLRALAGLQPISSGTVHVSGTPSLLGVNAVLMRKLTGERNIVIGALALGLSRAQIDAKFDEIVEFAGIGDAVHLPMRALSSGMAARLRFAISTAVVPDVLMIDESLSTGDAPFRERSKARIEQIRAAAGTIFFVSHSLGAVRTMCTRGIWIDKGQVRMDDDIEVVTAAYREHVRESQRANKRARREARKAKLGRDEWIKRSERRVQRQEDRRKARRKARRKERRKEHRAEEEALDAQEAAATD